MDSSPQHVGDHHYENYNDMVKVTVTLQSQKDDALRMKLEDSAVEFVNKPSEKT